MKYQITQVSDKITTEVLDWNKVLFAKEFPLEGFNLDEAKKQLRMDLNAYEVRQKEKEYKENKKKELEKLLNKPQEL